MPLLFRFWSCLLLSTFFYCIHLLAAPLALNCGIIVQININLKKQVSTSFHTPTQRHSRHQADTSLHFASCRWRTFSSKNCFTFNYQNSSVWALSDVSAVTLWWELCSGLAMMEKPPLRGSCFHSLCGNGAQFKEAPSLRSPIVLNGSQPKAALLFPLFQPQLYQTWCDRIAWPAPGSPSRNPSPTSCDFSHFLVSEIPCFSCSSVTGSQRVFALRFRC